MIADSFIRALAAAALLAAAPVAASAQGLFSKPEERQATATLHAGYATPDGGRIAGLRVDLAPGWKTYWRTPGDAGIPPSFDWSASENLKSVRIAWPTPTVFDTSGYRTIGYEGQMVLPLAIEAEDATRPVRLRLSMFYGLCEEICIPAREDLAVDIPPDAPEDGAYDIQAALASTPRPAAANGLVAASCGVEGAEAERTFSARLSFEPPMAAPPVVVAEGPEGVWIGPLETSISEGELVSSGEVRTKAGAWIDRGALRLTILDGDQGYFLNGCAPID